MSRRSVALVTTSCANYDRSPSHWRQLLQITALWNCNADSQLRQLQSVQNAAAQLITGTWHTEHITPVLQSLHWLPVRQRILFKLAVLVYKCLNGHAPAYLTDDCRLIRHYQAGLRSSSDMMKLDVPPTRTTFSDRSFAVNGPRVWNSLPASIRNLTLSLTLFSNRLRTHLFVQ